mgnify:CR=1 FL=1
MQNIKSRVIEVPSEEQATVTALKDQGNKQAFLEMCRKFPNYNFYRWTECVSDYPKKETPVTVFIGPSEVRLRVSDGRQQAFPIQRIRCWKVREQGVALFCCLSALLTLATIVRPLASLLRAQISGSIRHGLELGFEFLRGKGDLVWIT